MSVFDWQGKPSSFTKGKGKNAFNGVDAKNSRISSQRSNYSPIVLPNSSKHPKPKYLKPT